MPWIATTQDPGATFGNDGKAYWSGPNGATTSTFTEIALPPGVQAVNNRPSFDKYGENLFGVGGWTENIMMTREWDMWMQGMRPPVLAPTVALSAGPGITDLVICYLAWYDEDTDEWSGLSAPSATLNAVNSTITWSSLPVPENPRVTHLGLWRSVAGSLPRLVMKLQVGQPTIVEAATIAELGQAWVEDFELFPRCRYNVVWHDRQFMAGDDNNPSAIYCSLIGYPERKSSIALNTKTRQPVIGLAIVRDTLLVICPQATERISGWTEDDIGIEIAQPQIGGCSHHGIVNIHGFLWIPTHMGVFVTDGSGWYPMMEDVWPKWTAEFALFRDAYEASWAVHDPVSGVYKLYVGEHSDTPGYTFWVADYRPVIPLTGGGLGQPNWSYDVTARAFTSGGLLSIPGGRRTDAFLGGAGDVWQVDNDAEGGGAGFTNDDGDALAKQLWLISGADFFLDVGGDLLHGKRFTEIAMFVVSEDNDWEFNLYGGDEHSVIPLPADPLAVRTPSYESGTIVASDDAVPDGSGGWYWAQPQTVHIRALPQVVGRSLTFEVKADSPDGMDFRGIQVLWKEGPAPRLRSVHVPAGG